MSASHRTDRYNGVSIALHWLTALLFVAVYAAIELREFFPKGTPTREAFKQWHFMLGLSIFVLAWVRIAARLALRRSPAVPQEGGVQRFASSAVHIFLYALMIGMPLAGWLILSADGKPIPFFGLTLPPLVAPDAALGERVEELHKFVGTLGYFLIGLHAAAALLHHYVLRNRVLTRMLPLRS